MQPSGTFSVPEPLAMALQCGGSVAFTRLSLSTQ